MNQDCRKWSVLLLITHGFPVQFLSSVLLVTILVVEGIAIAQKTQGTNLL